MWHVAQEDGSFVEGGLQSGVCCKGVDCCSRWTQLELCARGIGISSACSQACARGLMVASRTIERRGYVY